MQVGITHNFLVYNQYGVGFQRTRIGAIFLPIHRKKRKEKLLRYGEALYPVTDRINGATDDRVNGASKTWSFSLLDGVNFGLFVTLFFSLVLYPPGSFLASDNSCHQG